jgi:hypothetical protein
MLTSPRPATQWPGSTATWPRRRASSASSTASATAPPFARAWPSWWGRGEDGLPGSFRAVAYDNLLERTRCAGGGNIGILTVAGEIVDGEAGPGTAGAETSCGRWRGAARP